MFDRRGIALSAGLCLLITLGFTSSTFAQLSDQDMAELRARAKAEGWTFEIDRNPATLQPIENLCGTVIPEGYEEPADTGSEWDQRDDLPAAFDWRDYGGCTPIRNQGGCGSCWAFSAVGAVESAILINDGVSVNLSEQWLVSCTTAGDCGGGWPSAALDVMKRFAVMNDSCGDSGAVLESAFPYVAWDKPCGCPYDHPYWIQNKFNAADKKQAILDYGPISVTVAVDGAFQAYDNGVFNACWNGTVNHAVVLVGWDDNQGSDGVWIMRNSWGTWWGEDGYMRIEYGCSKIGGNALRIQYRPDCNVNGVRDDHDIDLCDGSPWCGDCDQNYIPDECDISSGASFDVNGNGVPDSCDFANLDHVCVDSGATGANTGVNWSDAVTDIATAFEIAVNEPGVTEVWVCAGTYKPAGPGGDRSASIVIPSGVTLRGSFAGTETSADQRDTANQSARTIFSGDLNGDDLPGFVNIGDNSYHVVTFDGVDAATELEGVTIIAGNADGVGADLNGAGLFNSNGSPTVTNCMFLGNRAINFGGAVYNTGNVVGNCLPVFVNCLFSGNSAGIAGAVGSEGEALCASNPTFINCTLANNAAFLAGGVSANGYSNPTLLNCILFGNTDSSGDVEGAQVLGGQPVVGYCCIEGLTGELGGVGNIGADPMFVNAVGLDGIPGTPDDDLQLRPCSPCTDAGDNSAIPAEVATDLAGEPRLTDDLVVSDSGSGSAPVVDIGAYEFAGEHTGDLDGDGDVDLSDLAVLLANYGQTSGMNYGDGDLDGDGDVDLADLSALLSVYGANCN